LRNSGIEGLKDKINKLKRDRIPSIPEFLNSSIPELDPCPIFMQSRDVQRFTTIFSN
jgi:hypothetical protein